MTNKPFKEWTLSEYTDLLGSDAPSPGGGSAAAISASLGVALAEMVANLNAKKIKSNALHAESDQIATQIKGIRLELLDLATQDAEVFKALSDLWKDKGEGFAEALMQAAVVPLKIAQCCQRAAGLATQEISKTSKHLVSDLSECGLILEASFESAVFNIEINLRTMNDTDFVQQTRSEVKALRESVHRECTLLKAAFQ